MNISPKGIIDLSVVKCVEATDYDALRVGDVLFNNTNSPAWVGKTAYIERDTDWAYSNHMTRIRLRQERAYGGWVAHCLHYLFLDGFFQQNCRHHVNQASVNGEFLASRVSIPLPPLPEQQRIVAEIEKQFTRLDAGVAALKRVQVNLKRYRASVLKAACEGRLAPQDPNDEPADRLLARILAERRARGEAEHPGKKYVEPAAPVTDGLPRLPVGWCWASIDLVAECLDHKRIPVTKKDRASRLGQIPYYGANGQVGCIDTYIFDEPLVLIVEDETFTGREIPFSYKIEGKSWVNNHAHVLRPTNAVDVDLLNYSLAHYPFTPLTTGTTGRRKLTQFVLMRASYALPPLPEQHRIVAEVERRLSVVAAMEATVATNLARASRLRQAVLKRAFEGRLVGQDANPTRHHRPTPLELLQRPARRRRVLQSPIQEFDGGPR